MVLVTQLIRGAALAAGGFGKVKGSAEDDNTNEAEKIGMYAQARYNSAVSWLKSNWEATTEVAEEYSQILLNVQGDTIGKLVAFIERMSQQVPQSDTTLLAELKSLSIQDFTEYEATDVEAEQLFKGEAGRKDEALNSALEIGDLMLAEKGEQALAKAREYEAAVNTALAKITEAGNLSLQIQQHLDELGDLVCVLEERATTIFNELESQSFDWNRDASKFQELELRVLALVEIIRTPLLDPQGNLNPATATLITKYRNLP